MYRLSLTVVMIMSWHGNAFHITVLLCKESTSHWWFPSQRGINVELLCILCSLTKLLNKRLGYWWNEVLLHSCDIDVMVSEMSNGDVFVISSCLLPASNRWCHDIFSWLPPEITLLEALTLSRLRQDGWHQQSAFINKIVLNTNNCTLIVVYIEIYLLGFMRKLI